MALEGTPPLPKINNSNWTPMYIFLGLIPVTFILVALYSMWRDARTPALDIEMATLPSLRVLPLRGVGAASERPGVPTRRISATRRPRVVITRPLSAVPISPNGVRLGGSPDVKWQADGRGKDVNAKVKAKVNVRASDATESTSPKDDLREKGGIGSASNGPEEFEEFEEFEDVSLKSQPL
ncbi:hypothetical protein F4811DRAFT_406393 [Daldinia bambusicola]|nr:hypothetical protein F4811DRAFT_406393 [Daldinia bambusicola]